jgi:glycosyltransferase involved in cell wall biosynthesis
MLSKALVVGAYQRKAELLAAEPGIDLTVAVPPQWRDGDLVRRLERCHTEGYRLVETPIFRPGDFHLHFYPRFGRLLAEIRPALVHIDEEPYNLATYLALRTARRQGARTLFFTWQNLDRRYPPPFAQIERHVHRHADGAIAGSQTAAAVLRAKGYTGPLWVIPQVGVDPVLYQPPSIAADRTERSHPLRVGFAGRLVPAKGADLVVRALAGLPDVDWRLEIVGEGPEQAPLEALAESLGVRERVALRPWLASAAMPDFYQSLDVIVLPSHSTPAWIEQFGRVLTEAMACGVVAVGSDSGEIPHVIGDAGLVFPEGDSEALACLLRSLAESGELRRTLGAAGRERVLGRFTMAQVAAETAEVYRAILGAPRRSG